MSERREEPTELDWKFRLLKRIAVTAAYATLFAYALLLGLSGRF